MKRIGALLVTILAVSNISFAATYQGIKLDDKPLKCSLTQIGKPTKSGLTCIFKSNASNLIEVIFPNSTNHLKKDIKFFKFQNKIIFNLDTVAIYKNDEHNFDIYGVLNITPPDNIVKK